MRKDDGKLYNLPDDTSLREALMRQEDLLPVPDAFKDALVSRVGEKSGARRGQRVSALKAARRKAEKLARKRRRRNRTR